MKKYILLIAILTFSVVPVLAQEGTYMGYTAPEKKVEAPEAFRCPVSQMSDQNKCFNCHTWPTFAVKEPDPDNLYDYPNFNTKIRGDKGYILIDDIDAKSFTESAEYLVDRHGLKHIVITIRSFGGSLFDAWGIQAIIAEYHNKGIIMETRCSTFAMSAGFLVMVAGSKGFRNVSSKAELMWHELWTFEMFKISTPSSAEQQAKILRHIQSTASEWLASKSNLTKEEIDDKVENKEWWMNGREALEAGFVDGFLD
jgi:ATP-dependent protease ClpP protease subunit